MKCKLVKHRGVPIVYYKIIGGKNVKLKMQTQRLSLDEGVGNLNFDKRLCWELVDSMQQHNYDALIQKEEQRLNKSKREEAFIKFRYAFTSLSRR